MCEDRRVLASSPLLIDINPAGDASPRDLVQLGNYAYFTAENSLSGRELWRTDGTTLGTKLVKDIRAGSGSANPTELTAYKGSLYFAADDGVNGQELWKSDGTESGTVLVKDLHPGQGEQVPYGNGPLRSLPQELTVVGNQLFFSAISAANGRELWKSDGTADGTVLVKDIFGNGSSSVAPSSSPRGLVNLNGTLFFTATDSSTGAELWKSDGTSAGTVMVLDIFSGTTTSNGQTVANSSEPGQLTTVGSTLFFTAVDSGTGRELWKTDGTAAGTVRVKDVRAGADGALTSQDVLIRLGNTLFFSANDGSSGRELWKSDGTSVGTVRVKDIRAGAPDGLTIPGTWAVLGDRLYFAANDGSTGTELWKTDGTDAGTTLVRDLESGAGSSTPQEITTVGTRLFFAATTASGKEAWESDGTSAGTKQVADLAAGATSSNPSSFGQLGGLVLFSASDAVAGQELRVAEVDGRIDARLTIFVDSQAVTIPTGVGTAVGGAALSQIRSVNATGGIRVEPLTNEPLTKFTLGDFFTTWRTNGGQAGNNAAATLSSNQLLGNLANTTKTVKMYVNGQVSKDYENYAIRDGDQIVLVYGSNPVVSLNTNFGPLVMELFLDRKPITVNNFLTYINDGDYVNTFFHRSADSGGKDFVIQAGGFRTNSTTFTSRSQFTSVPQDAQIQNEPGISNVRGTVAMAKLGGQPNSATNQFFVNLHDDNRSLDTNNGGFTVFGAVLDMTTADTVAALPIRDQSVDPYRELPVSESNQLVVVQTIAGQGRIRGARYRDTNGNSRQDSGETGVANSVIYIDSNNNNVLDAGEVSTATDANGNYVFELNPGTYTVRAQASAGFVFTEPLATSKSYTVNVEIGREAIGRSFGESTIVAPTSVDLVAVSDTGTSDSDNFTNRNNSSAQRTLQFLVSGVTSGAEVRIFVDGVQMGTATATGTTVTVTTSGNQAVTDGQREVRAVQIVNGTSSATSPALTLTIDTIAPALFSNTAPALATVNTLYSFDANSPDENLSGMVYSLANAPAGMTISSAGVVSWTPTNTQLVPQQFDIRLSDVAGNAAIQSVSLTVLGTLPAFPDSYSIAEDGVLTVALANGVLFNDGGPNPGTLTASVVQTTSRGTLVLSPNGTFNYTPNANFFGADSFIYKANNGTIDSNHARVTINVTAVNDLPVGVANSYSVSEDTTLAVNVANGVLSNDTDADGDTLAVAVATQPANGSLILNSNGSFSYTPRAQFSGADSFTYTISDGTGNSTPVQVSLTVTAVNDAPVAVADTYSVNEDAVLNIAQPQGVLANDTDAEGSPLTATVVTQPTNGTVLLNANGSFTYTPKANFFGSDSFTYRANDGSLDSAAATVTITIADQPDPPSAVDDTASVVVTGALIDVLKNDVANAGNNQLLTIQSFTQGASGVVTLENNQLRYVPRSGFVGTDTFTYVTQNASGLSDSGSVTVTVTNPDGNRISGFVFLDADKNGTRATTESGVPGVLVTLTGKNTNGVALPSRTALTADDGSYSFRDLLAGTYEVTQRQPAALKDGKESVVVSGALAGEDKITNLVVTGGGSYENNNFGELQLEPSYVSIAWFFASSSKPVSASTAPIFRQMVAAGEQRSGDLPLAAAIRSGSTTPPVVNAIPVAVADSYAVPQGQVLTVNAANGVLKNDTDADGTTLTAIVATQPQQGALTLNADGSFTYTPTTTFNGTDAFTYRASDGKGTSAPQTVTITVGNPALNQVLTIAENSAQGTLVGTLTAGSALNQPITFALKNGSNANAFNLDGATGRVTVSDSVALNFEQQASYSLTVEAAGANGQRQNINATINVTNVNEKPVGVNDSYTVNENAVLTVDVAAGVLSNDTDPDANSLTVELVTNVAHGQLALNPNGSFSYTPTARFVGADSFTYRAKDATLSSDPITVAIQVNDVNAAPVAVADSFTTNEDVVLSVAVADGVLKNDTDADGDSLTAQLVTTVSKGQLIFNANGSFNYTPNANANGTDSFTYRVSDGTLTSNVVTVTLNVTSVNDPPVGVADSYTVNEDVTLTVNAATGVLKNDTDADGTTLTASVVTQPQHGSLTLNSDGSFTYQPTANYNGTDTFTYRAGDGTSFSAATTVTITVNAVNDGPTVVRNDSYRTDVNQVLTVTAANGVLANDQDPDGQALVATLQANVQHGTLDLSPNGSFVYTPTTGYRGADQFTYRAGVGDESVVATVNIVVNSTPVGANDSYSTVEDTVLTVNVANGVLKNDTDAEGDSLTATVTQQPQRGTLEMNTNGSFVYTPAANFNGADSFQYRVSDGNSNSAPVTVNITIEAAPDAPVAVNDNYSITRGGVLTVAAVNGVLKNDTDADAQMLTASVVTDPQNGTVALSANGSFVYTPAGTFVGTDTFTYRANDGTLNSNVATVTVNVTAVNSAPVGVADTYSATEDTTLTVNAANGVLKNDTDADGQTLTATLVVEPQHGTVTLNADGSFSYTPTANYSGADSFTYRASDGAASSGVTSVAITVNAVNDLPVAANDNYSMNQGSTLNVAVADGVLKNDTDADGNSMTAVIVAQAQNGAVTLNPNGSFSYTPTATFSGVDTFTYRANDGTGNSGVATVTINVAAVNRLPVAANDSYNMNQGGTLNVAVADGVLKNDTDADGNTMTAVLVAQAQNGAVTLNPSGSFSYTPTGTFSGVDTFTYRANDGTGNSNVATVTINVAAVNRAPVGVADTYSVNEDATLSVNAANGVLKNDTDADGQTLTASVVAQPQHGNVTLNADGSFSYTPTGNYHGPDSFTYRASDGVATSNVTTVSITVLPVNDAPVGVADSYATNIGRTLVVPGVRGVLANDTDVDLGTLTAVIAVTAANGLVSLNPSGAFDYTPTAGFSGTDTFTYRVDDGASLSQPTTVTVQVNGANQLIAEQGSAAGTLIGTLSTTVTGSSKLFQINRSGLDPRLALAADDHISGNPASPVVLIEYLDYGCPACRAIHPVVKQMEQQFAGQLLVVRRHLPVVTANSPEAAWAAEAASLQGKFNEMTDLLFEKQNDWRFPSVANPFPFFESYAQTLGLNLTQFLFDYSAPAIANRVTRDQTAAVGLGANATPWFFLGPQHITTPTSATAFAAQIQAAVDSLTDVVTLDRLTGAIRVLKPSAFSSSNTPFEFTVNVANTTGNVQTIPVRITVTPAPVPASAPVPANAAVPESESGSVSRQSLFVDDAFADDSWWLE